MAVKKLLKFIKNNLTKIKKIPVQIPIMQGNSLKGKCVFITGGSGGIGFAIADACLLNGASVMISGRNQDKLIKACNLLRKKHNITDFNRVKSLVLDITLVETLEDAMANAVSQMGQIDILVNNAGILKGNIFGKTEEEAFDEVLDTNLKGTYFISQIFSEYLIKNRIQGNILNISSVSGIRPAISPYMVSKWGEIGLTLGMAKRLLTHGIVVNGIAPGPTSTAMLKRKDSDISHSKSPSGRYVMPEEVANLAVFLVSDMGRMIVGETICLSGGAGVITFDDIMY